MPALAAQHIGNPYRWPDRAEPLSDVTRSWTHGGRPPPAMTWNAGPAMTWYAPLAMTLYQHRFVASWLRGEKCHAANSAGIGNVAPPPPSAPRPKPADVRRPGDGFRKTSA